jgi:hypothetical protein
MSGNLGAKHNIEVFERGVYFICILFEMLLVTYSFDMYADFGNAYFLKLCFAALWVGIVTKVESQRFVVSFSFDFKQITHYNLIIKIIIAAAFFLPWQFAKDFFNTTKYYMPASNWILFFLFVFRIVWVFRKDGKFVVWPRFGLQDILFSAPSKKVGVERPTGWLVAVGYFYIAGAIGLGYFVSQIPEKKAVLLYTIAFGLILLVPWITKTRKRFIDTSEGMTRAEQQAAAEAALRVLAERNAKAAHNVAEVAAATVMRAELDLTTGYDHYNAVLLATAQITLKAEQAQAAAEMARADAVAAVAAAEATAAAAVVAKAAAERAMQELAEQNRLIEAELNLSTRVDDDERNVLVMYRKLPYMERLKWTTAIKYSVQHLEFAFTREEKIRKREAGLPPD